MPDRATLADWQERIRRVVAEKGWSTDANEIFVLFTEEVGELAKELRRTWKRGKTAEVREAAAAELADVFMYLVDLANQFDVDLDAAVRKKMAFNDTRECGW
jgi:NTP pyrophosphatase (non-canonical NTP hydrolase)